MAQGASNRDVVIRFFLFSALKTTKDIPLTVLELHANAGLIRNSNLLILANSHPSLGKKI